MAKTDGNSVTTTGLLVVRLASTLGVSRDAFGTVVDLVVKSAGAVPFETAHDDEGGQHAAKHSPATASCSDQERNYHVRENRGKYEAVEEDMPELAAGFGLGDEDVSKEVSVRGQASLEGESVQDKVLLQVSVQEEVKRRDWEHDRL